MRTLTIICFLLFLLGVVLFLAQMWVHPWSPEIFVKIIITNAAFFAIMAVAAFLVRENKLSQKINGKNSLD